MTGPLIGRGEAYTLLGAWVTEPGGPITVWGPPGIGKTALVREVLPDWTFVDAREADAASLVSAERVIWDGVDPDVAREALATFDGSVVLTSRDRLDLQAERSLELGPLDPEASEVLLVRELEAHGHTLSAEEVSRIARPLDGLPLALSRAARWLDIVGLAGLTGGDPSGWRGPRDVPPHLDSVATALADSWKRLSPADQTALSSFALVLGPIPPELALAVVPDDALGALRRLRDASWLLAPAPGMLRMLRPVRAFVLRHAPPTPEAVGQLADSLLTRAERAWKGLDRDGTPAGSLAGQLDDLVAAVEVRSPDVSVAPALSMLALLRPSPDLEPRVDAALRAHPDHVDLHRARARLHRAAGDLQEADRVLAAVAPHCDGPREQGVVARERGVLAHRGRRLEAAAAQHYATALALHEEAGDRRAEALTRSNLAALAHDEGRFDDAMQLYTEALDALRSYGDKRLEGIMRSNLAVLEHECGREARARDDLTRAVSLLRESMDARLEAIARGNLGWVLFVQDNPAEAERQLRLALGLLDTHRDVRTRATCLARLGATLSGQDRLTEAIACFDEADLVLAGTEDYLGRRLVQLLRAFADVAMGARSDAVMRITAARESADDEVPLVSVSDDARSAVRALESLLVRSPGPALCVGEDAAWFRAPGAEPQSLDRYASARRLLHALTEARLARPGGGLSLDDLFQAGWPDERIQATSARNRVHVALNKLRALGLKPHLLRGDGGYLLDPELPVLVVGEPMPEGSG